MTMNGIDVSSYQPENIFDLVAVDFGFVKATEGTGYVSGTCDTQVQALFRKGKKAGVYHFASGGDPKAEAQFFVNHVKGYVGKALLVLDFEAGAVGKWGDAGARAFLDEVKRLTGVTGGVYASESVLAGLTSVHQGGYWAWGANWGANAVGGYAAPANHGVGPWPALTVRQYRSNGQLPGFAGRLDVDVFYGDAAAWDQLAKVGGKAVTPSQGGGTPSTAAKNADGSLKLAEDGARGPATIARWQEVMATPIDGKISTPSSALIKADQAFLNTVIKSSDMANLIGAAKLVQDGVEGEKTVKARQFWLYNRQGRAVLGRDARLADFDGVLGPETNRLHQHALNAAKGRSKRY